MSFGQLVEGCGCCRRSVSSRKRKLRELYTVASSPPVPDRDRDDHPLSIDHHAPPPLPNHHAAAEAAFLDANDILKSVHGPAHDAIPMSISLVAVAIVYATTWLTYKASQGTTI